MHKRLVHGCEKYSVHEVLLQGHLGFGRTTAFLPIPRPLFKARGVRTCQDFDRAWLLGWQERYPCYPLRARAA